MSELVTIATFSDPMAAHLAKTRLESHGIRAFVEDENILYTQPLYSVAVGGIKLRVSGAGVERAVALLKEEREDAARDELPPDDRCPRCGSTRTRMTSRGRRCAFLSILLLNFPIGSARRKGTCRDCGHKWTEIHGS